MPHLAHDETAIISARERSRCGVILFSLTGDDPDADNRRVLETIGSRTDWAGQVAKRPAPRVPLDRCAEGS
jgi:hypothetical protein